MTTISGRYQIGMFALIISSGLHLACSEAPQVPTAIYQVQRLSPGHIINVNDHSLTEWGDSLVVMRITPQDAKNLQWKNIRGRTPKTLSPADVGITVYMALDTEYWYVALEAHDDKVLPAPPAYPYSGDCLEIFFAGKELDSPRDFHDHLDDQAEAAFFQFELPVGITGSGYYFSEWRTGSTFRTNVIGSGFMASAWTTASGWSGEARIPIAAFEPEVRSRIELGETLKMNIDYLDYDIRTARQDEDDDWGFLPDNVLCLDAAEENANTPKYMRSVIFK